MDFLHFSPAKCKSTDSVNEVTTAVQKMETGEGGNSARLRNPASEPGGDANGLRVAELRDTGTRSTAVRVATTCQSTVRHVGHD